MNKVINKYVGNAIVAFSVLSYFQLFNFIFIPYSLRILSQLISIGLLILFIILKIVYHPVRPIKMNFALPIAFLILGVIPSFFVAQSYHSQNMLVSFYASRTILLYLLYFFVHLYRIEVKFILQVIVYTGLFAAVLFFMQYIAYPNMLMDLDVFEDRGTIRFFVPGMLCSQAAYFYFLDRFVSRNKVPDLIVCLAILSMFILQGSRSFIFSFVFLTLIYLLFTKKVKSRLFIIVLLTTAILSVFLAFREIFLELTRVSNNQMNNMQGAIRIKAANFFLTDFMPNTAAYIFGNGNSDALSPYDIKMSLYADMYGYYLSDIGLIGDYIRHGIIFILAGIVMLVKSIAFKVSPVYHFLKYYIYVQCFTQFTGKGILSGVDVVLILILYILDKDRNDIKPAVPENQTELLLETHKLLI